MARDPDHRRLAAPAHRVALGGEDVPGLPVLAAHGHEDPAREGDLARSAQRVEHVEATGAREETAALLVSKMVATSSIRAIGTWKPGTSGIRPVALATTASSQRSGTARCGSARARKARRPTTSSAAPRPSRETAEKPGTAAPRPSRRCSRRHRRARSRIRSTCRPPGSGGPRLGPGTSAIRSAGYRRQPACRRGRARGRHERDRGRRPSRSPSSLGRRAGRLRSPPSHGRPRPPVAARLHQDVDGKREDVGKPGAGDAEAGVPGSPCLRRARAGGDLEALQPVARKASTARSTLVSTATRTLRSAIRRP